MTVLRARVLTPDLDAATPGAPHPLAWIPDAIVCIDEAGRLEHVGPYDGRPVDEDLRPGVLLPGFVDGHVHYPQTRIVGSATGPLLPWLQQSTFPEESRFADPAHAGAVADLFAALLASAGTTLSFVYASRHRSAAEACLRAMDDRGLRGFVGPVWMDRDAPTTLLQTPEASAEDIEALVERWHGRDDRLQVAVIPRFALTSGTAGLRLAADTALRHGLWVSTHLAENPDECDAVRAMHGRDYLAVYDHAGLVNARSVYAHCIHLSPADWDRFAQAGAVVAHCPDSNAFLGSGHMPTPEVVGRQIPLCIGTDVAAGRSFRVPRILSSAYDNALAVGHAISPATLLWWGTRSGAAALGHDHVGAVKAGLDADLVLVDAPPWAEDADAVLASTLFWADAPLPRRTWVRGRVVWDRDAWHARGGIFPWD